MDVKLLALWAKIKTTALTFWARLNADFTKLWAEDRIFFIAFGVIILTLKFRTILINLIVTNAKSIFTKAQTQDDKLTTQENAEKTASNGLVQDAMQLPKSEQPVSEDWYKNEK
jgi:hypothetical protein